jgi:hypothetical protein
MNTFVLGSKPLINLTLRSYEIAATTLMLARNITSDLSEIAAMNKEINSIIALAEQCEDVLKNMED